MEFFRSHRKIIVSIMAISFILWTIGMGLLMILPILGGYVNDNIVAFASFLC